MRCHHFRKLCGLADLCEKADLAIVRVMKKSVLQKTLILSLLTVVVGCSQGGGGNNPLENSQGYEQIPDSAEKPGDVSGFRLDQEVSKYKNRYQLNDVNSKLTDHRGAGHEELWGTRNFRVVLQGVMYRGGANNKYLQPARSNVNPLADIGLNNLCREDFGAAVYLYSENYSTAPKSVNCTNTSHQPQTLQYKQYAAAGEKEKILELVFKRIKGTLNGPIYAHCWNGWHSSGLISAIALKQFCDWTDAQADAYWVKNTDGNYDGFTTLRKRIKDFKPLEKFKITAEEKALICPQP